MMKNRIWKRFCSMLLAFLLAGEIIFSNIGTLEVQASEDTEDTQEEGNSLKDSWDIFVRSLEEYLSAWDAADADVRNEVQEEKGSISSLLLKKFYEAFGAEEPAAKNETQAESPEENSSLQTAPGARMLSASSGDTAVMSVMDGEKSGSGIVLDGGTHEMNNFTYTADTACSAVTIKGTVTLKITGSVTLKGGNGSGKSGGGAGICVPEGSSLFLIGNGTLNVTGGSAAAGQDGNDSEYRYIFKVPKDGGAGGSGGGGAGAGIGGAGGAGGAGGTYGTLNAGRPGGSSGIVYLLDTVRVNAAGGRVTGSSSSGGDGTSGTNEDGAIYCTTIGGAGGGGGGGGGFPAPAIGGGGAGGGNGGSGGKAQQAKTGLLVMAGAGGSGGGGAGGGYLIGSGGGGGGACTREFGEAGGGRGGSSGGNGGRGGNASANINWAYGGSGGNASSNGYAGSGGGGGSAEGSFGVTSDGAGGYSGADAGSISTGGLLYFMSSAGWSAGGSSSFAKVGADGPGKESFLPGADKTVEIVDINKCNITLEKDTYEYDGQEKRPIVKVSYKGVELDPFAYSLSYSSNVNVGTAKITMTGGWSKDKPQEKLIYGTVTKTFQITKQPLHLSISAVDTVKYSESFIATLEGNQNNSSVKWSIPTGNAVIEPISGSKTLVKIKPTGTGSVTVKAEVAEEENFMAGTAQKNVAVAAQALGKATIAAVDPVTYTGSPREPSLGVYVNGELLTPGNSSGNGDYYVTYSNNVNAGTAEAVVHGTGKFGGEVSTTFQIVPADIENVVLKSQIPSEIYTGSVIRPNPSMQFNGIDLVNTKDYTIDYSGNINAGTATVYVYGTGNFTGTKKLSFTIQKRNIADPLIGIKDISDQEFTGKPLTPVPEIYFSKEDGSKGILTKETDYTLSYSGNYTTVADSPVTVTISGKGNYTGSTTREFDILRRKLTVKAEDAYKQRTEADPSEYTYTISGAAAGYDPVFTGALVRESAGNTDIGVYKILQGTLKLNTAKEVNQNYELVFQPGDFSILTYTRMEENAYLIPAAPDGDLEGLDRWYRQVVKVMAPTGFEISSSNSQADTNQWSAYISYPDGEYTKTGITYFLRRKSDGAISQTKSIMYKQDATAPKASIVMGNQSWQSLNTSTNEDDYTVNYYKDVTSGQIMGSDEMSGIAQSEVKYYVSPVLLSETQVKGMAESMWTSGTFFRLANGKNIIYAKVKDRAGNVTYANSGILILDTALPIIKDVIVTNVNTDTGWITSATASSISGNIKDSGIAGLRDRFVTISMDGGNPQPLTLTAAGTFTYPLKHLSQGKHTFVIHAEDRAGNYSQQSVEVKVDTEPPELTTSVTPRSGWSKTAPVVSLQADDTGGSPVKQWRYSLDGGSSWKAWKDYSSTASFKVDVDGVYPDIRVQVKDESGNVAGNVENSISVSYDSKTPALTDPVIDSNVSGTDPSGNLWYGKAPAIVFSIPQASDQESPNHLYWKMEAMDDSGNVTPIASFQKDGTPVIPGNGRYRLTYYIKDEAGNQSAQGTRVLRMDTTEPKFADTPYTFHKVNGSGAASIINALTFGTFFKEAVRIQFHVSDPESDVKKLEVLLNGKDRKDITAQGYYDLPLGFKGEVTVVAVSGSGLKNNKLVVNADGSGNIVVENTPPNLSVTTNSKANDQGWFNTDVTYKVQFSDDDSGLALLSGDYGTGGRISQVFDQEGVRKEYTMQFTVMEEGSTGYRLSGTDYAGMSVSVSDTLNIDKTAPKAVMEVTSPADYSGEWTQKNVELKMTASDAMSGLSDYSMSLDNGKTWETWKSWPAGTDSVTRTFDKDGSYEVLTRVRDKAGNTYQSAPDECLVINRKTDAPPDPVLTVTPGEGGKYDEGSRWYTGNTPFIELEFPKEITDDGANYIFYKLHEEEDSTSEYATKWNDVQAGQPEIIPDMTVDGTGNGTFKISYFAEDDTGSADISGNRTQEQDSQVNWDNRTPEFGEGEITKEGGGIFDGIKHLIQYGSFYNEAVKVTIPVNDDTSGMDSVTYAVNGEAPKSTVKTGDEYSFILPLGTKGTVSVQAADVAGNLTTLALTNEKGGSDWNLENKAPVIGDILASGSGSKDFDGNVWYNKDITINSLITDTDSGLDTVSCTIGTDTTKIPVGADSQKTHYQLSQTISQQQKDVPVEIRAKDNAGNESVAAASFNLDKEVPADVSMQIAEPSDYSSGVWTNQQVRIKIDANDSLSGVKSYSYTLDGGKHWSDKEWNRYGENVISLVDGVYDADMIQVRVSDAAGNTTEMSLNKAIKQDTTMAPKPELNVSGTYMEGPGWYVGTMPVPQLTINQKDEGGARNHVYWAMFTPGQDVPDAEGDVFRNSQDSQPVLSEEMFKDGKLSIAYYAEDEAGNRTNVATMQIQYDPEEPEFDVTPFQYKAEDDSELPADGFKEHGNYFQDKVKVVAGVTDGRSGIASLTYAVDGGAKKNIDISSEPYIFTLPPGTNGEIYVEATDKAGNVSGRTLAGNAGNTGSSKWIIGDQQPSIENLTNVAEWYDQDVEFSAWVKASNGSGLKEVTYKMGDEEEVKVELGSTAQQSYQIQATLKQEGAKVPVNVKVTDNAGNRLEKTFYYKVDKTEPQSIKMEVTKPSGYSKTLFANQDLTVKVLAEDLKDGAADEASEVAEFSYSLDRGENFSKPQKFDAVDAEKNVFVVNKDGVFGAAADAAADLTVVLKVWDTAGNCHLTKAEGSELLEARRDTTPPPKAVFGITPSGEKVKAGEEIWYNGSTAPAMSLTVEGADAFESQNHVWWCVYLEDQAMPDIPSHLNASDTAVGAWRRDGAPELPDNKEGRYILAYFTTDEAGNASLKDQPATEKVYYDRTAPDYKSDGFDFDVVNTGVLSKVGNFLTFGNFFQEAVKVTVRTEDNLSKCDKLQYSFDEGKSWSRADLSAENGFDKTYTFRITDKVPVHGKVKLSLKDMAGNQKEIIDLAGEAGSTEWTVESSGPVIGNFQTDQEKNANGWFRKVPVLKAEITDASSGLKVVSGKYAGDEGNGNLTGGFNSRSDYLDTYTYETTLPGDTSGTEVTVEAADNANNQSEKKETFLIDTVKPEISDVSGWPDAPVDTQPVISFTLKDDRSGIDPGTILVKRKASEEAAEGETVSASSILQADGSYKVSAMLAGNGCYTIDAKDKAGNPIDTYTHVEEMIDVEGIQGEIEVKLTPNGPDGHEGWYVTTPQIEIIPKIQSGASRYETYYSVWEEGAAEPDEADGILFARTRGIGTTGTEDGAVQPQIEKDGIWNLHVWMISTTGERRDYNRQFKVDTHEPADLTLTGAPERWVNTDVTLKADAKAVGTELKQWRYSLDQGVTYSEWKPWETENAFTIQTDIIDERAVTFQVEDRAGNVAVCEPVTVLRDTVTPELTIRSPENGETNTATNTKLVLESNEPLNKEDVPKDASLKIFNYGKQTMWGEIPFDSDLVEISEDGLTVSVSLPKALGRDSRYYVEIENGYLSDKACNLTREFGGRDAWNFRTEGMKAAGQLNGYEVEVFSGAGTQTESHLVQAVLSDIEGYGYTLVTRPEYVDVEGKTYAKLRVTPTGEEPITSSEIKTRQDGVVITRADGVSFDVLIPKDVKETELLTMVNKDTDNEYILHVILTDIEVEAKGALNPEVDDLEVINSTNLRDEVLDGDIEKIKLNLNVTETEQPGSQEAWEELEPSLPVDKKVKTLDIKMDKEVTDSYEHTKSTELSSLDGTIKVTLDLSSELKGCKEYTVVRIHEEQITLLEAQVSQDGNRISFDTDRFSDYAIVGTDDSILMNQQIVDHINENGTQTGDLLQDKAGSGNKAALGTAAEVSASAASGLLWWLLIGGIVLILLVQLMSLVSAKKKEKQKD